MFCLPYAGGGASAYTGLLRELTDLTDLPDLTVTPLQLPGRENRIAEPPAFTVQEIADEIAPATDAPYLLYGHSMGARLAFEVVRELRRRGLPGPRRLYVGGAHPPHRKVPLAASADLPDDAFIDQLVRRSGALPELKHVPELRELLLPVLRADFAWIKNHRYAPEPPLDCPIVAFTGLDDGEVGAEDMLGWARHTTAGFRLRTLRGGHLFVKDRPAELAALVAADLTGRHTPPEPDEVHLWLDQHPDPASPGRLLRHHDGQTTITVSHADGLTLVAAARDPGIGVAVMRAGHSATPPAAASSPSEPGSGASSAASSAASSSVSGPGRSHGVPVTPVGEGAGRGGAELSAGEREQIEGAAEQDRRWLALRAVAAKRALMAADGQGADPALADFPDLADPGPWRAQGGPGLDRLARWRVVHLPLHTSRGEALAAVAVPYDRVRLRFDMPAEQAG
ncbi:thioesterase II family protein [Nonomuraea sp. ZG12]|uniref:thioesterase II family protein n=1 Tax=Nonomuraea sp. ZG12 TaxID=3452207 RepID=UPI003F8BA9E7